MPTSNYKTVLRHILMLSMIPKEPESIATETLWEWINNQGYPISLRIVQKDLKEYKMAPFLQIRNKKFEGSKELYWYFKKNADVFDIPQMSKVSALVFNLVEKFLKPNLPVAIQHQLQDVFLRARNRLKQSPSHNFKAWPNKIKILPRGHRLIPAEIKQEAIDIIFEALWNEKQFEATYRKRGELKEVEYRIHPLGLVFREEAIYLICTLWDYDDVKQLAMHRFQSVSSLHADRKVPKGFNLDDYVTDKHLSYIEREEPIILKVLLDAGAAIHLYESKLSEDQILTEQENGQVILNATVKDTSELRWWLLSFGEYIEVIDPEDLREEFGRIAKNMASKYR
jgi:predicted DNA-binding transcriptional regulator YafY